MALSSSFRDRLELMERTRNHRLSLLHAERELQARKSEILSAKLAILRSREQRCLNLDRRIASELCRISALRSQLDGLDDEYQKHAREFRVLKGEVEMLEEAMEEKERHYEAKYREMEAFKERARDFGDRKRREVGELRHLANELKSTFIKLQGSDGFLDSFEIAEAEATKSSLLAVKENLDKNLACNYEIRAQLQNSLVPAANQERRNLHRLSKVQQRCSKLSKD